MSFGGRSLVARRARYARSNTHAPEAMTRNLLITPSPERGRGNGSETRPRAKPPARGHVAPNLPALGKTLALKGGEEVSSKHGPELTKPARQQPPSRIAPHWIATQHNHVKPISNHFWNKLTYETETSQYDKNFKSHTNIYLGPVV